VSDINPSLLCIGQSASLLFLLVVVTAACNLPANPSAGNTPEKVILGGTVVDAVDMSPLVGARLSIPGLGVVSVSGGDGSFTLPIESATNPIVETSAAGYWTRATRIAAAGTTNVVVDLLPNGKGFNLAFFDYVLRRSGGVCTPPGGLGTVRWQEQPTFKVWTSEFSCVTPWPQSAGGCITIRATGRSTPPGFSSSVRSVLTEDVPAYSGGVLHNVRVIEEDVPTGTRLRHPDDTLIKGFVTIAYVDEARPSIATVDDGGVMGITASHIQIFGSGVSDVGSADLMSLASHEVAHALGFYHPCGVEYTLLPSTMRVPSRPTDADRLHGRILYRRSSGSRSPDLDADGFVINMRSSVSEHR